MKYLYIIALFKITVVFLSADLAYILEPIHSDETPSKNNEIQKIVHNVIAEEPKVVEVKAKAPVVAVKESEPVKKETKVQRVTSTQVMQKLGEFLAETLDVEGELRLYPLRGWREIVLKSENYDIEFWGYPAEGLKSNMSINFKITSEDKEVGSWIIPVKCELWRNVYFTTKRLNRGIEIDEQLLRIQSVDVLRMQHDAVPEDIDVKGYEIASTIPAGKPLLWNSIAARPDIRRGKVVEVIAQEGSMRITAKGVALQNGLVDEFIGVRNLQSKKDIQAQIINENTVRVYF